MITVNVAINGVVIMTRSAKRIKEHKNGASSYKVDSGEIIFHYPKLGAKELAIKLLNLVEQV